ncbi:MAG TPA: hypothetical protein DGK91_10130 [Clostridium sp.]|nr:hypothetical protein [Clostridium sp.]
METNKIDYLPLGSIVILNGGSFYPQGLIGDQIMYFNHEDIKKVVFTGFSDDDDKLMVENINEWFENSDVEKGNTLEIKMARSGLNG